MLSLYLLWMLSLGFAAATWSVLFMAVASLIVSSVIGGLALRFVTREYERAMNLEMFKTRSWLYRQVGIIAVALLLGEISILVAFL